MRKIGYFIILVVFLIFVIPIVIIGGVDSGIKIPGVISSITDKITKPLGDVKLDTKNGGPKIKVYLTKQNKVVEMYLEEYLRGVVSAEMPVSFDIEALKSQAIAARTFAVANMKQFGGGGCAKHKEADVCDDVHCQAYMDKQERFKNWSAKDAVDNWNKISQAVEATKGKIISYNGQLARHIKYHSTSGGKTEDSVNVFGYKEPYLVSVESPFEEEAPSFESKSVLKKSEFLDRIKKLSPSLKINSSKLGSEIKILERTEGDRVKSIKIGDKTFSGVDIRWGFNLKSANFDIKTDSKYVTFNVRGYGHGVGMSQWGANEMGKRGKKYDEILKHYYKGVEIKQIEDVFKTVTK